MANRIQLRRDTASNWTNTNPILADGEPGLEYDTNKIKIGDGANVWSSLPYATGEGSGSGSNYGDSNVESLLNSYTNNVVTTGHVIGSNMGNSVTYLHGDGSNITGLSSYGDSNVASYLSANPPAGTYSNSNVASYLTTYNGTVSANSISLTDGAAISNIFNDGAINFSGVANQYAGVTSHDKNSWIGVLDNTYAEPSYIPTGGGVAIQSNVNNPASTKTWIFKTDGDISFPDGTIQSTAWKGLHTSVANGVAYIGSDGKLTTDSGMTFVTNGGEKTLTVDYLSSYIFTNDINGLDSNITISATYGKNVVIDTSGSISLDANITAGNITASHGLTTEANANINVGGEVVITNQNGHGGAGYAGMITMTNTTSGSTNPNKFIRINSEGNLEIINSAYSGQLLSLSDAGDLTASYFHGDGSNLTGITVTTTYNDSNVTSLLAGKTITGNIATSGNILVGADFNNNEYMRISPFNIDTSRGERLNVNTDLYVTAGDLKLTSAGSIYGNASGLTNIPGANITGLGNIINTNFDGNASNILYGNGSFAAASAGSNPFDQSLNTSDEVAFYIANIGGLNVTGAITLPNAGVANGIQSVDGLNTIYFDTDNSIQFIANNTFQSSFNANGTVKFGGGYVFPNVPGSSGQVLVYDADGSGNPYLTWQNQSGGGGITLTSLSVGTPNTPSGDGSLSYDNTTGTFTFTPPDLSIYVTGTPWMSLGYLTSAGLSGYVLSSSLATVATSGSYNDLTDKPNIPDGTYANLSGKPDLSVYAQTTMTTNLLVNGYYIAGGPYDDSRLTLGLGAGLTVTRNLGDITLNIGNTDGSDTVTSTWTFNRSGNLVLPAGGTITTSTGVTVLKAEQSFESNNSNFNALSGHRYGIDTSDGSITATLPSTPTVGDAIYFMDFGGSFSINNFVIIRNGNPIMNETSDLTVSIDGQSFGLAWTGTTWRVYS
jgi:hypothetical protein